MTLARLDLKSILLKILVAIVYVILGSSNRNVTNAMHLQFLEREGDFWIAYVNTSDNAISGYLVYDHCNDQLL